MRKWFYGTGLLSVTHLILSHTNGSEADAAIAGSFVAAMCVIGALMERR